MFTVLESIRRGKEEQVVDLQSEGSRVKGGDEITEPRVPEEKKMEKLSRLKVREVTSRPQQGTAGRPERRRNR